jgi:hypothetical protein
MVGTPATVDFCNLRRLICILHKADRAITRRHHLTNLSKQRFIIDYRTKRTPGLKFAALS